MDAFEDYYEFLGIPLESTPKEISKAYRNRTRSLRYHPDKVGPDDTYAETMFLKLTKCYDILKDPLTRRSYDTKYTQKLAAKQRIHEMSLQRQTLKRDLDEREEAAKKAKYDESLKAVNLQRDVDRIRQEGVDKMRKREMEVRARQEVVEEQIKRIATQDKPDGLEATLTLKFGKERDFTESKLLNLFGQFGKIEKVLMSKRGRAVVSFESILAANNAISSSVASLHGIKCSWALGMPSAKLESMAGKSNVSPESVKPPTGSTNMSEEYEMMTLMKMRNAVREKKVGP